MNKKILMVFLILILTFSLFGCEEAPIEGPPQPNIEEPSDELDGTRPEDEEEEDEIIEVGEESPDDAPNIQTVKNVISRGPISDINGYELLSSFSYDIDNDSTDELIAMYALIERDSSGELMFDDGHQWMVVVRSERGDYVLFHGYVQLGIIDMYVYEDEGDLTVATLMNGSSMLSLSKYEYNKTRDVFTHTRLFTEDGNVNMLFKSH